MCRDFSVFCALDRDRASKLSHVPVVCRTKFDTIPSIIMLVHDLPELKQNSPQCAAKTALERAP